MPSTKSDEKRKYVSIENFIKAYENTSHRTIAEVASVLGVKPAAVSLRASKLRKKGVDLRKFNRSDRPNIAEKANEILASIRKSK